MCSIRREHVPGVLHGGQEIERLLQGQLDLVGRVIHVLTRR
jgi:hypothetical protein